MRKSILQFAKKLWSSEDSGSRRSLCTNCKTDPVTQSSLCKKCCRRSTVCAACYSRILSLHHTRLDRYGSIEERAYKCPECNLSPVNTSPHTHILEDNSVSYITPQKVNGVSKSKKADTDPLRNFQNKRTLPSLTSPPPPARMPLSFSASAPVTPVKPFSPVQPLTPVRPLSSAKPLTPARPLSSTKTLSPTTPTSPVNLISPVKPPRPVNHVRPRTLTKEKSFSSSESEYQSCSENVDPDSPFTPTTPTPLGGNRNYVFPGKPSQLDQNKYSYQDKSRYSIQDKTMPQLPETIKSPKVLENINNNKCVIVSNKDREMPRTVAIATKPTPPVSMVTRSRITNPNRPVMIRSRAIEECDEFDNVMVKRTSMGDNVVLKPEIILPSRLLGKLPDKKENIQTGKPTNGRLTEKEEDNEHLPVEMKRSYSESNKDRRLIATKNEKNRPRHGSMTETRNPRNGNHGNDTNGNINTRSPAKRTVRIAEEANIEHSRPCSLELEHVTVGEVTPTVYVKDKNDVIDESIQKSESVLKRSLSVSNSRLQRKLSKKLLSKEKERNSSNSDETGAPHFLRRNRSSSSVDKSSPPPDLQLMTNAGLALEDIQAFGLMYVQRLENKMRNIDSLKELEKQHNISCRERLKTALDTHEQLAAGLDDVKRQLKECMEKYRFISETFV